MSSMGCPRGVCGYHPTSRNRDVGTRLIGESPDKSRETPFCSTTDQKRTGPYNRDSREVTFAVKTAGRGHFTYNPVLRELRRRLFGCCWLLQSNGCRAIQWASTRQKREMRQPNTVTLTIRS